MAAISVRVAFTVSDEYRRKLKALEPAEVAKFMERMGQTHLVTQARKNIVRFGTRASAGAPWAALSPAYAKRKKDGHTPGRGSYGYAMLRDTGTLYDALVGNVVRKANGMWLYLDAEGSRSAPGGGTISNADLLRWHHKGAGNLPRRSVAADMRLFEARFAMELGRYLGGKGGASLSVDGT